MGVYTEADLRKLAKTNGGLKEINISRNDILTPSAKSFISDNNIKINYEGECEQHMNKKSKYQTIFGAELDIKPEHMTHLKGNMLVFKDHPRIAFRGMIDELEAEILICQTVANRNNLSVLVNELEEILGFVRKFIRYDVLGEILEDFTLCGLTTDELREMSHFPKKYFGLDHFMPDYNMPEPLIYVNKLRTKVRQTELAAYRAFKNEYGAVERPDIILGLNRLSSLCWIIMFKIRTEKYK